jgi:hypothetical protein
MQVITVRRGDQMTVLKYAGDFYVRLGATLPFEPLFSSEAEDIVAITYCQVKIATEEHDFLLSPHAYLADAIGFIWVLSLSAVPDYFITAQYAN